ncbi:META domain-containing protein [Pseudogemmobacter humi]|uniref:META domain protein n=1 Tax=Pseudogemmobacter humi TaxID=2483812 RepID=A0A3P5XEC4_9RHOB|nr:META domain-containing protein [Pseudogemmobacter humi]VDC33067.1 META domain protein [Pseudogemmobacter humi]
MRKLLVLLALIPGAALADETIASGEWQLLALDGQRVNYEASFAIDAAGSVSGKAPCNNWFGQNQASLPALGLGTLGSTRMYCDRMAEEERFLSTLGVMTSAERIGENLVLRGAGRSMEFSRDPGSKASICVSCGD